MKEWSLYERKKNGDESISIQDLAIDFLENYCSEIFEEEVAQIVMKKEKAKLDYYDALNELHEKENEYQEMFNKINKQNFYLKVNSSCLEAIKQTEGVDKK